MKVVWAFFKGFWLANTQSFSPMGTHISPVLVLGPPPAPRVCHPCLLYAFSAFFTLKNITLCSLQSCNGKKMGKRQSSGTRLAERSPA